MSLINATHQLNQIAKSAYEDPHRALQEVTHMDMPSEILHLRDAVLFHIHALRKIDLQRSKQKVKKVTVTRAVEARVREFFAHGLPQTEIADLLRLSAPAVNLLIHGKYRFPQSEASKPKKILSKEKERMFDEAYVKLLVRLGRPQLKGGAA